MRSRAMAASLLAAAFSLASFAGDINEELWEAARKGDSATVKALIARGADVNAKFNCGTTALFQAARKGHLEVVKVLLEHGAEVNVIETCYSSHLLGWVAGSGQTEIVKLLLDKGAEAKDDALFWGTSEGHIEIVRAVLDKGGASSDALSIALGVATRSHRAEIAELLKKAGAVPPPEPDFQVDTETIKTYEGVYASPDGMELTLVLKEGKLMMEGPFGEPALVLGAFDKVTFRPRDRQYPTIAFEFDVGKVVGMTLKYRRASDVLKKVEGKR